MIIKNAYYPKQMPTQIVVEAVDGRFFSADLAPFRRIAQSDLRPLAFFRAEAGDEIPGYTLKYYGLEIEATEPLKRFRRRLGLSQAKLAEASGVNVRQIQKIEAGEIKIENVTLGNAKKLADALGVDVAELLNC